MTPQFIMKQIAKKFSVGEIRTLCFDLGVNYENLPVSSRSTGSLARELVLYLQRRDRMDDLIAAARRQIPSVFDAVSAGGEMPINTMPETSVNFDWSTTGGTIDSLVVSHATLKLYVASYEELGVATPPQILRTIENIKSEVHKRITAQKKARLAELHARQGELMSTEEKRALVAQQIAELEQELQDV